MRLSTKYFLIVTMFVCSGLFAQKGLKFELTRNYTSPSDGPRLKGYTGTIFFKTGKNLGFSVSSGISEMEQSSIYLRDYKNSDINYRYTKDMTIVPLIFGVQYVIGKAYNLEYVAEAETGLNLLRFELNGENKQKTRSELHFGIGTGAGIHYSITQSLQFVLKTKFNIVSKIGNQDIFDKRTRYVSVLTGLRITI